MELFFNRLEEIAEWPGAYLASPDVFSLKSFIEGWLTARESNVSVSDSVEHTFISEFQTQLAKKYKCELSISWSKLIFIHSQNAYDALQVALKEMIEFREKFLQEINAH